MLLSEMSAQSNAISEQRDQKINNAFSPNRLYTHKQSFVVKTIVKLFLFIFATTKLYHSKLLIDDKYSKHRGEQSDRGGKTIRNMIIVSSDGIPNLFTPCRNSTAQL